MGYTYLHNIYLCVTLLYLLYLAGITERHRHKLGPGSDGARAAQSLTPPAPRSRGRLGQVTKRPNGLSLADKGSSASRHPRHLAVA